ncbi:acetyl/propionyl/methylcrotonyl-CoA carboxylase subunit alpha [Variovorax sp. M-6]|uniref:acetyl-CoA carboxylase biotin carboxylase subunit n=1 Tax=Variovorax sp. M-6 TaxID=3233041 RepID=UPI003F981B43
MTDKHTLLIANRGEIACRVIRAARKLSLRTIAVYSEADRDLPHVQLADEAVAIGPARASESYLRQDRILDAARRTGATLLHPGYGFLAESASFAQACRDADVRFVGPSPDVIRLMGDKDQARQAAARAGVPVLPGTGKLDPDNAQELLAAGAKTGFPLFVKAAAGGGGIGMRVVPHADDLVASVRASSSMAQKAFSDGSVYMERQVERARHVEVQVFGFGDGTAVHLFDRDCSVQRRHQKVIEEAGAPLIADEIRRKMTQAAVGLAASCRYEGAGTVEFLFDTATREFFFLEMNTRIQVEHAATEMITGIDLVGAQLRLAMGEVLNAELAQHTIEARGHAIEARVYAENPARNFMPSPGPLDELVLPEMAGVRIDCGYRQGNVMTPYYDPMVMKVLAHGPDRLSAIDTLRAALAAIRITGLTSNLGYLDAVLAHRRFRAGDLHTGLLTELHAALTR